MIDTVGVLVLLDSKTTVTPLKLSLSTPERRALVGTTDQNGWALSTAQPAWAALVGGPAIGDYGIALKAADNPSLQANGKPSLAPIKNIVLLVGYSFTPRN